jgi:hypothetical protein
MEVVVASAGGVGTTFLINFIAQYRRVNHFDDEDGIKHLPVPPVSLNKKLKLIYVYGNPQLAAMSLFRREYHHLQSGKLRKCVADAPAAVPVTMTLDEYAAKGIDGFYFREHFENWYSNYLSSFPTLFIRYETLFENLEPLLDFLELPSETLKAFPKKKKRNSAMDEMPEETRQGLQKMYAVFEKELAELADTEIRQGTSKSLFSKFPLTQPYLKCYAGQLLFEVKEWLRINTPQLYRSLRRRLGKK